MPTELSPLAALAREALYRSLVPLEGEKGVVANEMHAQLALAPPLLIALDVPSLAEDSDAVEWVPLAFNAWGHAVLEVAVLRGSWWHFSMVEAGRSIWEKERGDGGSISGAMPAQHCEA